MDRSFLSHEGVIAASRDFVCIRLATYEDASEAEFLKTIFINSGGELDNTVFVLLSPDTKKNLCRPGRGPQFAYRTPDQLAAGMNEIASQYSTQKRDADVDLHLPQMKDFRLGLNVSSCDGLSTVVCVGDDDGTVNQLKSRLAELAFDEDLAGKFAFASTSKTDDLKQIEGYKSQTGFLLVQPGDYGIDGKLVKQFPADVDVSKLKDYLVGVADGSGKTVKNHNDHVRTGRRNGQNWQTEIPVTDQMSLQAMERGQRGQRPKK